MSGPDRKIEEIGGMMGGRMTERSIVGGRMEEVSGPDRKIYILFT